MRWSTESNALEKSISRQWKCLLLSNMIDIVLAMTANAAFVLPIDLKPNWSYNLAGDKAEKMWSLTMRRSTILESIGVTEVGLRSLTPLVDVHLGMGVINHCSTQCRQYNTVTDDHEYRVGVSINNHPEIVSKVMLELGDVVGGLGWVVASADVDDESYSDCHCEPQIFDVLHHRINVNPHRVELLFNKCTNTATTSFDMVLTQAGVTWNAESVLRVLLLNHVSVKAMMLVPMELASVTICWKALFVEFST